MSQEWAAQELAGIDLGDARLNKRSVTLLDRLADKPTASIPHACNGWAETQAAYRFLAQEDIGWEDILAPHFSCTQQHMQGRPVVLCIQDTTELNFNGQQTEGLGTLSFAAQRGMYLHPTYAVSPEREPLGVLDAWMWVRDASKTASRSLPAGAKESCRWLEGYERLAEQASLLPDTRLVYVADRESDFLDWMDRASALGTPVDWLIRAAHNRKLVGQQEKLWDGFAEAHVLGEVRFYLPARRGYRCRLEVEIFFDVLENGCKVEALQLSSIERLELALALFMIIAWRIQMLMRLGRICPEMNCEVMFERDEWQAAYIVARKPIPEQPPSLNTVVRLIASFGGFLGRKGDGEPGVKTIWTGLQRVMDFAAGIRAYKAGEICV